MRFFLTIFLFFISNTVFAECVSGNCTNGYGTYIWPNGDRFVGEFKNGQTTRGKGENILSNGDKYIGEYLNTFREGNGTYIYVNGDKYIGEFKKGEFHGQGTFIKANGEKISGEFFNGKFQGQLNKEHNEDGLNNKFEKLDIKNQCLDFGFTEGTENFANCQLQLTILEKQNNKSNQITNNNSQNDYIKQQNELLQKQLETQQNQLDLAEREKNKKVWNDFMDAINPKPKLNCRKVGFNTVCY